MMFFLCNKYRAYALGSSLLLGLIGYLFIPAMYITSGGVESGMTAYSMMVVIAMFFLLQGRMCIFMVSLEFVILGICLYVNYRFPEIIQQPLSTQFLKIFDNAQAMFIVSMFVGMTIKFQAYVYRKEKSKVEAASQAKSEFLTTMSHEIRTPLNAIIGLSEIQLQKELPKETYTDVEKIYNSGSILLGIINDILDISKIETGQFELIQVEYDTASLINDTVQLNILRIASKQIVFDLEIDETIPVRLFGDELRIKQILNNLLSNAFKYTKEGKVTLGIHWERRSDAAWFTFTVRDTGAGIRKEDICKLFSEYRQLDTKANRRIEGTGLGLSITKKLLDMMGGKIYVESEHGKGSIFTVDIPQTVSMGSPIGAEVVGNLKSFRYMDVKPSRGRSIIRAHMPYGRVLVVDDVATNLDVAKGLMMPYGLMIDCVISGRDAIDLISDGSTRYDIVFMDHMMPEMDGIEATRIIRNEIGTEYARTVPIIALTANAVAGNDEMFARNGFNAFISKPIDLMHLDTVLNQWVRGKHCGKTPPADKRINLPNAGAGDVMALRALEEVSVDGLDLRAGVQRYAGEDSYLKILESYMRHTPEVLIRLGNVSKDTLHNYAVDVHGLKGSSYGICANEIGELAETLEQAAKSRDFETVSKSGGELIGVVDKLLADLGWLLGKIRNTTREKSMKASPDDSLLEKMLEASERFDSSMMGEIVEELERYDYESGSELVSWLRKQLDNLEYEAVEDRLRDRTI
jgi:signal transduction histidine kinase/DNA-binding response OmpR family regulator